MQEQDVETNVVIDEIVQEHACIMFYLLTDVHYLETLYINAFLTLGMVDQYGRKHYPTNWCKCRTTCPSSKIFTWTTLIIIIKYKDRFDSKCENLGIELVGWKLYDID